MTNKDCTTPSLSYFILTRRGFESTDGAPLLRLSMAEFCDLTNKGFWRILAYSAASIEMKLKGWNKTKQENEEVPERLKKECEQFLIPPTIVNGSAMGLSVVYKKTIKTKEGKEMIPAGTIDNKIYNLLTTLTASR